MNLSAAQMDRAIGALVASAAGDALGAAYEFDTPGPDEPRMVGGGAFGWDPGEWTDDTQMAICIAEEAAGGSLDPVRVGERFIGWLKQGPPDVGNQTRAVLGGVRSAEELAEKALRYHARRPNNSDGNGSLMRTAPVALVSLDDDSALWTLAQDVSALTHAGADSREACALWSCAIAGAVRNGSDVGGPAVALRHLLAEASKRLSDDRREVWTERIDTAFGKPPEAFTRNGGAVGAFQAAISAIASVEAPRHFACTHLSTALKAAVRIGGDTDTVAAIAGGFLGAYWGQTALPATTTALLQGGPGYRSSDLVRLASLSVANGRSDSSGWPQAERLLPYYEQKENEPGRWVRLQEEPKLIAGDVMALHHIGREFECDVVMSLCRIGPNDVPQGVDHHVVRMLDFADPQKNPNLEWVLVDLACSIDALINAGKTVFLHCVGANSRTPTVAGAFIAQRDGVAGREALASAVSQLHSHFHNRYFTERLEVLWPSDQVERASRRTAHREAWEAARLD